MSNTFEDHLWQELVREHGHELAAPHARAPHLLRPSLAASGLGAAGVATALTVLMSAAGAPPAFAVTKNRDGTVTVTIREPSGIKGTNAALRDLGIRALVAATAPSGCASGSGVVTQHHATGVTGAATWTFRPAVVTSKHWLVLAARSGAGSTNATTGGSSYLCPNTVVHDVSGPSGPSGPNTVVHDLGSAGGPSGVSGSGGAGDQGVRRQH